MKTSDKILNLRKKRGMSQEELAEKLNVARQTVSRWELGSAQPDATHILRLSRLFGITADDLLDEDVVIDTIGSTGEKTGGSPLAGKIGRIAGLCAGLGLLGNFAIYMLSRMIPVMVPWISYDEEGRKLYHWSSGVTGRSYRYFIQEYGLEPLAALLWLLVVAGIGVALFQSTRRRK